MAIKNLETTAKGLASDVEKYDPPKTYDAALKRLEDQLKNTKKIVQQTPKEMLKLVKLLMASPDKLPQIESVVHKLVEKYGATTKLYRLGGGDDKKCTKVIASAEDINKQLHDALKKTKGKTGTQLQKELTPYIEEIAGKLKDMNAAA